jgi:hypothetical protein
MPAPPRNQNARKGADEIADAHLHVRVRPDEKELWQAAAYPQPLSSWIRDALNAQATKDCGPTGLKAPQP